MSLRSLSRRSFVLIIPWIVSSTTVLAVHRLELGVRHLGEQRVVPRRVRHDLGRVVREVRDAVERASSPPGSTSSTSSRARLLDAHADDVAPRVAEPARLALHRVRHSPSMRLHEQVQRHRVEQDVVRLARPVLQHDLLALDVDRRDAGAQPEVLLHVRTHPVEQPAGAAVARILEGEFGPQPASSRSSTTLPSTRAMSTTATRSPIHSLFIMLGGCAHTLKL